MLGRIGLGDALPIESEKSFALDCIEGIDIRPEARALQPFDDALRTLERVIVDRVPDIDPCRMRLELIIVGMGRRKSVAHPTEALELVPPGTRECRLSHGD